MVVKSQPDQGNNVLDVTEAFSWLEESPHCHEPSDTHAQSRIDSLLCSSTQSVVSNSDYFPA